MNIYNVALFDPKAGKQGEGKNYWFTIVAQDFHTAYTYARSVVPKAEVTTCKLAQEGVYVA